MLGQDPQAPKVTTKPGERPSKLTMPVGLSYNSNHPHPPPPPPWSQERPKLWELNWNEATSSLRMASRGSRTVNSKGHQRPETWVLAGGGAGWEMEQSRKRKKQHSTLAGSRPQAFTSAGQKRGQSCSQEARGQPLRPPWSSVSLEGPWSHKLLKHCPLPFSCHSGCNWPTLAQVA